MRQGAILAARSVTIAVWYLLMGRWTPLNEIDKRLDVKIGKVITQVGATNLKKLGQTRKGLRTQMETLLKTGRVYQLDPNKKYEPKTEKPTSNQKPPSGKKLISRRMTLREEYGLAYALQSSPTRRYENNA